VAKRPLIITHGIVRDASHMKAMAEYFEQRGHIVFNISYTWRTEVFQNIIDEMASKITAALATLSTSELAEDYDIIAHSMGGLVVRGLIAQRKIPQPKNVILLGTPNKGSEAIDKFTKVPILYMIYGPLARDLSTGKNAIWQTFPESLPDDIAVATVAGNKSESMITKWLLPRPNDGKVTVESSRLKDETDHILLPIFHDEMYLSAKFFNVCADFLDNGSFNKTRQAYDIPIVNKASV
jgi:hypothetical protein